MKTAFVSGSLVLGGQDRPFEHGAAQQAAMQALSHRRDAQGLTLSAANYHRTFGVEALRLGPLGGADGRDFVYTALVAGYARNRMRVDFTAEQVGRWLAEAPEAAQPFWDAVTASLPRIRVRTRPAKRVAK